MISPNCFNVVIIQCVDKLGIRGADPKPHMQCFLQHTRQAHVKPSLTFGKLPL